MNQAEADCLKAAVEVSARANTALADRRMRAPERVGEYALEDRRIDEQYCEQEAQCVTKFSIQAGA
jgi:hypothetical protein